MSRRGSRAPTRAPPPSGPSMHHLPSAARRVLLLLRGGLRGRRPSSAARTGRRADSASPRRTGGAPQTHPPREEQPTHHDDTARLARASHAPADQHLRRHDAERPRVLAARGDRDGPHPNFFGGGRCLVLLGNCLGHDAERLGRRVRRGAPAKIPPQHVITTGRRRRRRRHSHGRRVEQPRRREANVGDLDDKDARSTNRSPRRACRRA
mmetsp:Transcript_15011/g.60273  ORF Transcript_15011/g.60273 Transcript_15011/m.60273 type:complete len:209 (+) Transcript_15011:864-1490(+)